MPRAKPVRPAKVVGLHGAVPAAGEPDLEIIERLKELLEDAKRGNIVGLAYMTVRSGENVGTGWIGKADSHRMGYGVARLYYRMMAADDAANS